MKNIFLLTSFILFFQSCSAPRTGLDAPFLAPLFDTMGIKDPILLIETETLFENGIVVESREYYKNGNLEEEVFFTDGALTMVKEYYEDGKLEEQLNVKNRTYVEYNEDGSIDEEGEIDDFALGILVSVSGLINLSFLTELVEMPEGNGISKEYYENGTVKEKASYNNGKLHGISREYYEDGSLKSESNFNDGVLDGAVREYYPK